jgi:N-acetylmuramoyl-L-alanine amidase
LNKAKILLSLIVCAIGINATTSAVTAMPMKKDNKLPVKGVADSATVTKLTQQAKSKPRQSALDQLAHIIHSEARGESFKGQVAVGSVVMNRVHSPAFPATIGEVIFQSGQFSAIDDGQYWLTPNQSAYLAAQEALNGSDETKGALYYYNPKIATSSWSLSRPTIKKIGNHVFTQ